jgi:hypothetical protein
MARRLERAEQRVIDGDRLIAQQKELIAKLSAVGLDPSPYRNALVRLEQAQSIRVQSASELRRELQQADLPAGGSADEGRSRWRQAEENLGKIFRSFSKGRSARP